MLNVDDLRVSFGGVRALDGVSLEVPDRSIVGLVGPNGSGKSTLLNAVCGLVPATGTVTVGGDRIHLGRPLEVRRHGVLRTFQTPQVSESLTCLENVLLADGDRRFTGSVGALIARPVMIRREHERWERAARALTEVGLAGSENIPAGLLPYGRRRLLELARILGASPRIVLLDEPSAGLNEAETEDFAALLQELGDTGVSLLIVDHKVDFLDSLCSSLVVLELGRKIAEGTPREVWSHQRVIDAYLGAELPDAFDARSEAVDTHQPHEGQSC